MLARSLTTAALTVLLVAPALLRAADAPKGDKDLEGEWEVTSFTSGGIEVPPPPAGRARDHVIFHGDTQTSKAAGSSAVDTSIKLDTSKTPHTIDVVASDPGNTQLGIYEVKGDDLSVCLADPGKNRPTKFSGKDYTLLTLKRVKK